MASSSTTFQMFLDQLCMVGRIVDGKPSDEQDHAYGLALDHIDDRSMFAMCMTSRETFVALMKQHVIDQIKPYMNDKLHREAERKAATAAASTDDTKSVKSDASSQSTDLFTQFKNTYSGMSWADIDELEQAREAKELAEERLRVSAAVTQAPSNWARMAGSNAPATQATPPHTAHVRMPKKVNVKPENPTNWKSDRAKTVTSESWFFKLDLYSKEHDWFLWDSDSDDMPIGWRCKNGWFTSRKDAMFQHRLTNCGDDWIHRTFDKDTDTWVTKDYETYKAMMQASVKRR